MAINVRKRIAPALDVPVTAGGHTSGELCQELGKIGVAVLTNTTGNPNVLIEHGVVTLPVSGSAGSIAAGAKVYAVGTSFTNGSTLQAFNPTYRSSAVTGTLTSVSTSNTFVGTTVAASYADGASVVADIELLAQ